MAPVFNRPGGGPGSEGLPGTHFRSWYPIGPPARRSAPKCPSNTVVPFCDDSYFSFELFCHEYKV